jgi:hypothetical protein
MGRSLWFEVLWVAPGLLQVCVIVVEVMERSPRVHVIAHATHEL